MKLKSTKTSTVVTKNRRYDLGNSFNLTVISQNDEVKIQTITKGRIEYNLVRDGIDFRKKAIEKYFYAEEPKGHYWWQQYIVKDPFTEIEKNGFNENNLICFESSSHNYKDSNGKYLDMLIHLDYINGFRQKDPESDYQKNWNWKALIDHLKNHLSVVSVKEEEVPYYNRDFCGQMGLEVDVIIKDSWRFPEPNEWKRSECIFGDKDPLNVRQFIID